MVFWEGMSQAQTRTGGKFCHYHPPKSTSCSFIITYARMQNCSCITKYWQGEFAGGFSGGGCFLGTSSKTRGDIIWWQNSVKKSCGSTVKIRKKRQVVLPKTDPSKWFPNLMLKGIQWHCVSNRASATASRDNCHQPRHCNYILVNANGVTIEGGRVPKLLRKKMSS